MRSFHIIYIIWRLRLIKYAWGGTQVIKTLGM